MYCLAVAVDFFRSIVYIKSMMSGGAKTPDLDACGLFRAVHSHNPLRYLHIVAGHIMTIWYLINVEFTKVKRITDYKI